MSSGQLQRVADRPDYYSPTQVAGIVGISLRTVRTLIASGELEAVRIGPKLVRVPAAALDHLIRPYNAGPAA